MQGLLVVGTAAPHIVGKATKKPPMASTTNFSMEPEPSVSVEAYLATKADKLTGVSAGPPKQAKITSGVEESENTDFGYTHTRRFGHRSHYPSHAERSTDFITISTLRQSPVKIPAYDGPSEEKEEPDKEADKAVAAIPSPTDEELSSTSYPNDFPTTSEVSTGGREVESTDSNKVVDSTSTSLPVLEINSNIAQLTGIRVLLDKLHQGDIDRDNEFKVRTRVYMRLYILLTLIQNLHVEVTQLRSSNRDLRDVNRDLRLENTKFSEETSTLQQSISKMNHNASDKEAISGVQAAERKVLELRQAMVSMPLPPSLGKYCTILIFGAIQAKQTYVYVVIDGTTFHVSH